MLKYLFGFETYSEERVDFFFNLSHLLLLTVISSVIFISILFLKRLGQREQNRVLLACAVLLIVLELSRIGYNMFMHLYFNNSLAGFDWWQAISFQMCAMMVWFTAFSQFLLLSEKAEKLKDFCCNLMFGGAMVGASMSFLVPALIHTNRPILHFLNMQTIMTHALLIFVPAYLAATKRFQIRFKNTGKVMLGLLFTAAIAMTASQISGNNFMFMKSFSFLENLGLFLPFPLHIPLMAAGFYLFVAALYLPFEIKTKKAVLLPIDEEFQTQNN